MIDRENEIRRLQNWYAWTINTLQEQSRHPNYAEAQKTLELIHKQLPAVRRLVILLENTAVK